MILLVEQRNLLLERTISMTQSIRRASGIGKRCRSLVPAK